MEQRTEIRDGQVFTVTVIPPKERKAPKKGPRSKWRTPSGLTRGTHVEKRKKNKTFKQGFEAAAAREQERLDRHSAIAKTL